MKRKVYRINAGMQRQYAYLEEFQLSVIWVNQVLRTEILDELAILTNNDILPGRKRDWGMKYNVNERVWLFNKLNRG